LLPRKGSGGKGRGRGERSLPGRRGSRRPPDRPIRRPEPVARRRRFARGCVRAERENGPRGNRRDGPFCPRYGQEGEGGIVGWSCQESTMPDSLPPRATPDRSSRTMARTIRALAAVALCLSLAASARAQDGWATSIYSAGGAELRVDERVFTLFAALNELGYDVAPVTRQHPIPKREFDPVRQAVRDAASLPPALRAKFEAFFDKNPLPVRA